MPNVVIRRGESVERTAALGQGPIVVGRGSDCDIVLDHGSVSRRHASVAVEGGCVVVRDLGSRNGLYRGRERVTEWRAAPGEQLGVGIFNLEITDAAAAEECERTRLLSPPRAPSPPPEPAPTAEPPPAVLRVTGPDGSVREHVIAGDSVTIGRAAEAPLRLDDRMVSRSHARVVRDGARWRIVDAGSTNGFSVNGAPVKEAELAPGDEIGIGPYKLVFTAGAERRGPFVRPAVAAPADRPAAPGRSKALRLAAVAGGGLGLALVVVALLRGPHETRLPAPPPPPPVGPTVATVPPKPQVPAVPPAPAGLAEPPVPPAAPPIQPPPPQQPPPATTRPSGASRQAPEPQKPSAPPLPKAPKEAGPLDAARLDRLAEAGKQAFKEFDCDAVRRCREQAGALDSSGRSWQLDTLKRLDETCAGAKQAEELRRALADARELQAAGKTAEAIAAYNVVLARSPGQADAAAALQKLEQEERERLAKIKAKMADAEIYDGLGDSAAACALWREVLRLEPRELDPTRQKAAKRLERCKGGAGGR